jgi:hypothetical protein
MNYKFTRNTIIVGLLAVGVGLWGGNPSSINAAPNTSSGSESGNISGEFEATGFDNPTYISNLVIDNNYGIGMLSPLSNSTITFSVTDIDAGALDDVSIEVRFFFEDDYFGNLSQVTLDGDGDGIQDEFQEQGDATLDAAYDAHNATTNDGDAFVLENKVTTTSSDYFQVVYAPLLTSSEVTWSLGLNGYSETSDYTRDFSIGFQISKVAKFTYTNDWTLGVRVLNSDKSSILAEYFSPSYDMEWYGEIVTPETTVFFNGVGGSVDVGSEYEDNTATILDVVFISNGSFDQLIGTDVTWQSDKLLPGGPGYYTATAATSASDILTMSQTFHLVVSNESESTGFSGLTTVGNYDNANTIVSSHNGTTEEGSELDYYLYLKTSETFQNANYYGQIYLGIQNTSFPI